MGGLEDEEMECEQFPPSWTTLRYEFYFHMIVFYYSSQYLYPLLIWVPFNCFDFYGDFAFVTIIQSLYIQFLSPINIVVYAISSMRVTIIMHHVILPSPYVAASYIKGIFSN